MKVQIPRYPAAHAAETPAGRSGTQPRGLYSPVLSQVSLIRSQVSDRLMISKGATESGHLVLTQRQLMYGQWCFGNEHLGMAKALTQECPHKAGAGHGHEENPTPPPG